jgi:lipopolysaccharide transport system ATP-binding protein
MSGTVIQVQGLSKLYRLGQIGTGTLAHDINRWWAQFRGKPDPLAKIGQGQKAGGAEFIWALREVSFEVTSGEVLGIIGRNGAGKSTLLKILSRVTAPTSGEVRVRGRVASLLEVGTGFHPELSGRENIFLNGAILGMTRAEIRKKFDEIVAFSEVETFIDTPVKRYSSGMYVRLAFAVAAHLEPEILIVDEVLAVGDGEFQKKCLGKMGEVAGQGRTVLFVSHNLHAISELCSRTMLMKGGTNYKEGPSREVVAAYLAAIVSKADVDLDGHPHRGPQTFVHFKRLVLEDRNGERATVFLMNEPFIARIQFTCLRRTGNVELGLKISSRYGAAIHYLTSSWEGLPVDLEPGLHSYEVRVPHLLLYPGTYQIGLWVSRGGEWSDASVQEVTTFTVMKGDVTGHPTRLDDYAQSGCEVYVPNEWKRLTDFQVDRE